jgi:hypothetical protein
LANDAEGFAEVSVAVAVTAEMMAVLVAVVGDVVEGDEVEGGVVA